jgi:putative ABC transport system permease protein
VLRLALAGVRHNLGRYVATLVAIITGVAFFAASGFIGARVTDGLEGAINDQYGAVDVAVVPADDSAPDDTISVDEAEDLLAVDGVEGGAGTLEGGVSFRDADGNVFAKDAAASLWIEDEELNPFVVADGEAPQAPGEIAVDRGTAEEHGLGVGDATTVLTPEGPEEATVVGITSFGDRADALSRSGDVSLTEEDATEWLAGGEESFTAYYLRTSDLPADVADAVADVVPPGYQAQTGEEFRDDKKAASGTIGTLIERGLQAFALLALLVGGFVIYNTFSVIVAQRLRELAVLAAIGATGKQLKRSLRREGLVIGLLGSVLGVVAGGLLTTGGIALAGLFGIDVPGAGVSLPWGAMALAVLLGTLITVVSVSVPARRAARTEPIEALQETAAESASLSLMRGLVSGALVGLGLLLMLFGSSGRDVGGGALFVVVGMIAGGPFLAVLAAKATRPALERVGGLEGRLAADNTVRSPKRTATTANALFIGVFLVTLVAVSGTSLKEFSVAQVNEVQSADFTLQSGKLGIGDQVLSDVEAVEGVDRIALVQQSSARAEDTASLLSGADVEQLASVADIETNRGDLADMAEGTVAVLDLGEPDGPKVGDTVTIEGSEGSADLEVVALVAGSLDSLSLAYLVDEATFRSLEGDVPASLAYIGVDSDAAQPSAVQTDIEAITDQRPDLTLTPGNFLGQLIGTLFDFVIQAVIGLLLMSVIIALIGIVNTMSLSILERRRELGLLRIVGMTDPKVRRMVSLESILISLLGTVTGLVTGIVVSLGLLAAVSRLGSTEVSPDVPLLMVLGILVLGVALGFLAALIPARRSTRLDVLDAVQAT